MTVFPMPIGTPVLEANNSPTMAWSRYFKVLGDWLLQANKVVTTGPLSYVQQGVVIYVTAQGGATDVEVNLPAPARLPFFVGPTAYPAGTKAITVTAGSQTQFWYVQS
jgi:hypothetical protein